ncbi:MAG: Hsp20/alpha crystallin family protein [Alphaproteobacteria bacterium]|nr:Hsp20/alpha crystallin family protein [Alphaproteobacteria bacterium]
MVEPSPHTQSAFWPTLFDPMRRLGSQIAEFFSPPSDASRTDDAYVVQIELPGVKEEDINVDIEGNLITIKGEKRTEKEEKGKTYFFSERTYGSFQRAFRLPPDVDHEAIEAHTDNGVLTLTMGRKKEQSEEGRSIPIKSKYSL